MYDSEDNFNKIEAQLIEQEHRPFRLIWNFFNRKKKWPNENDPRRKAASKAIFWRLLASPTTIAFATGSILSFVSVYFLYKQNQHLGNQTVLFEKQTTLIESQNTLVQQQAFLSEAARRSSQTFIMGEVLSDLNKELENKNNKNRILSNTLTGRIISLSRSMKPYKYLINDTLISSPLSPERGQLLISLLESNIDTAFLRKNIFLNGNFQYSDLQGTRLFQKYLSGLNLRYSNLKNARIYSSNLEKVYFGNAILSEAFIQESSLKKSNFIDCTCDSLTIALSNMEEVSFNNADLSRSNFGYVNMTNNDLRGATLEGSAWGGVRDIYLHGSKVDRGDWLSYIKDSLKFKYSERIFKNYTVKDSIIDIPNNRHEWRLIPKKGAYFGPRIRRRIIGNDKINELY